MVGPREFDLQGRCGLAASDEAETHLCQWQVIGGDGPGRGILGDLRAFLGIRNANLYLNVASNSKPLVEVQS